MKVNDLKKQLEATPDDAEVTYGVYQGYYHANRRPCLIISWGNDDIFIDVPDYKGLPGSLKCHQCPQGWIEYPNKEVCKNCGLFKGCEVYQKITLPGDKLSA